MSRYERQKKSAKKHPVVSSSTSRAALVPAAPSQRPDWKGPGFIQRRPKQPSRPSASNNGPEFTLQPQHISVQQQQILLNIFRTTFPISVDYEALKPVLQEINNALQERKFELAFGKEEWLEAYAVRWSPSRSLCYAAVLVEVCEELRQGNNSKWVNRLLEVGCGPARVVCFGGDAAEVVAFGGMLKHLRPDAGGNPITTASVPVTDKASTMDEAAILAPILPLLDVLLVNSASWSSVNSSLSTAVITPPILSNYASANARANNASLLSSTAFSSAFKQCNILDTNVEELRTMLATTSKIESTLTPVLITLFFTLHDLYTDSIAKTTAFLLKLTKIAPKDSLLLVVDSPGSQSEAAIGAEKDGAEKKRYPMHWMMDHILLGEKRRKGGNSDGRSQKEELEKEEDDEEGTMDASQVDENMWEKVLEDHNRWFKLDDALKYPVSLENIRFQVHLFRRL